MTWTKYLVTTAFLVLGVGAYVPDAEAITAISACTAITTSGSYILTRNLVAAGNCLVVAADFVTTDLAGHTISGNGTGGGITTGSDVGITVRGGFRDELLQRHRPNLRAWRHRRTCSVDRQHEPPARGIRSRHHQGLRGGGQREHPARRGQSAPGHAERFA